MADNLRKELDMWEIGWKEPSNNDPTPEEVKAKTDELVKVKAEWLKKAKKKKWNDDLEKELVEDYKKKLIERVYNALLESTLSLARDGELLRIEQLMTPSLKWDYFRWMRPNEFYWDIWMRKKTIIDADIEGRKVAIRSIIYNL
jgi:hypothetical protein